MRWPDAIVVFVGACTPFGTSHAPADASDDVVDASLDAGADAPAGIPCGEARCSAGEACCLTADGPACGVPCEGGYSYTCVTSADCESGSCCLRNHRAAICEPRCDASERPVCSDESDCFGGDGQCRSVSCSSTVSDWRGRPFKYCPESAALRFGATLENVSCTF